MAGPIEFFGGTPGATTVKPSAAPAPSLIDADFLGDTAKYKIVTQNGRQYVVDGNANQVFVIVTGSGKNVKYEVTGDLTKAQAAYIKNFAGGLPALKKSLLNAGYLTQSEYDNNNYIGGLVGAISDLSVQNVQAYAYEGKTEFKPMTSFLAGQKPSGSGTGSKAGTWKDTTTDITSIGDAYKEINDYMLDVFGREATQEEKDAYYKDINAREIKSGVQTVTVRDATGKVTKTQKIGAPLSADERTNALNGVVKTALKGTDAETILSSSKGSKIAQDIAKIQKYAADYGQPMTAGQAMKYILEGYGTADYVDKQKERLRLNAMTMFGNLKDHIQNGGTVKDIADQYAYIKAKKLGIALTDSMADKDVVDAITRTGGLVSTADFSRQMQANPLWRQTEEAHNTAADFANTILKSFGFMG